MNDDGQQPLHLNVLSSNAKVEELRAQGAHDTNKPKNLNDRTPIDVVLDQSKSPQQKAIEAKVIDAAKSIYDPEIPVNIYELGLIYGIDVAEDNSVIVKMTLTAPGCPVAGSLVAEVERKIEAIEEVPRAKVELVWDPPWTKERMSEAALLELGLL